MTNYVYLKTEPQLWTVGFYTPEGKWIAETDCKTESEAAERVHWLNGGNREQERQMGVPHGQA